MNVVQLDITEEQRIYLLDNSVSIAETINNQYSYSDFNEFIVEKLFEELSEAGLSVKK